MNKKELPYKNTSGFRIPKDYFEDFEARMMHMVNPSESEFNLKQDFNPFKVPPSYFQEFEERILHRIDPEKRTSKIIFLFSSKTLSYVAGIAAVLAIIFISTILTTSENVSFGDLDMVAVENYLLETLDMAGPEEIPMINEKVFSFATSNDPNLDREALYEYLNENIEDPSLLLNDN